jgi:murein L,D-transpeptidase YcbB/YkuD
VAAPARAGAALLALATSGAAGGEVALELRAALRATPADAVVLAVQAAWADREFEPRFVEAEPPYRPTPDAYAVLEVLVDAPARGLPAAAYRPEALRAALESAVDPRTAARAEAALALTFGRHLADAGFGRIDPRALGHDLPQQRRRDDLQPAVRRALGRPDPREALAAIEPSLPLYRTLRAALPQWRARAAGPAPPALPPVRGKVEPGDAWPGVAALRARLQAEGDLPATARDVPSDRYAGDLPQAVRRFQQRHGLEADGILGARTLAELAVPAADRIRSIELTLERLRWLGATPTGRYVAVNLPAFRLWAVDGGRVTLSMAVVVGRVASRTPVFVDAIEAVEFNPYWNVPRSIAARELYPTFARDPGRLAAQHMELIGGDRERDLRAALARGAARLRQRPGPWNALGRVKFVMPNPHDVYLHDTPARTLFARSRRDFSHGCIRLEDPAGLAAFVLQGRPEPPQALIDAALASDRNRVVPTAAPIPVLIFYATVIADAEGRLSFLPDLYGHDARLDQALRGLHGPAAPR